MPTGATPPSRSIGPASWRSRRPRSAALALGLWLLGAPQSRAGGTEGGSPGTAATAEVAARMIGAALTDGVAHARLTELTDGIGPRLSGSPGAAAAVAWAVDRFRADGLTVRTEKVLVPHWVRGVERGELVARPGVAGLTLALTALGGSGATPAEGLTAEVIEVRSLAEVRALGDRARGKIVLLQHAMSVASHYGEFGELRTRGPAEVQKAGGVAALVRSLSTASLRAPHTGATMVEAGAPPFPAAALAAEDADLIHRLLQKGSVQVRLWLSPRTLPDVESANVVAEVRGRERPEEVVVIGGHLDSWDLGQGAVDDGAGVVIVMEALRLIAREHPRRTVRGVLFMNEENGLRGGKTYAIDHAGELSQHVAALEADAGAGRPLSIQVHGGPGAVDLLRPWMTPLESFGCDTTTENADAGGADINPMSKVADPVPMVSVRQDSSRYFDIHHSAADTLDKVKPLELAEAAAAFAWTTWALAEMPRTLPRPAPRAEEKAGK